MMSVDKIREEDCPQPIRYVTIRNHGVVVWAEGRAKGFPVPKWLRVM